MVDQEHLILKKAFFSYVSKWKKQSNSLYSELTSSVVSLQLADFRSQMSQRLSAHEKVG